MFTDESKPHDQFTMISQIGNGSFGKCLLCKRVTDGEQLVLKKSTISNESKNEARLLKMTSHENVVKAFESYLSSRSMYIVLEYMAGGNLHEHIKIDDKPLKDKTILNYTAQLASALAHIHELRIIHRDVKPRNILLSEDFKVVKLCDFGIALRLEEGQTAKGGLLRNVGTTNYMAPEILEGRDYEFRCDIWSLGCVVYEMVERKKAFPGTQELSIFHKICKGIVAFPEASKLNGLIKELLTLSEEKRPSASEVIVLLEAYRNDTGRRLSTFWRSKKT